MQAEPASRPGSIPAPALRVSVNVMPHEDQGWRRGFICRAGTTRRSHASLPGRAMPHLRADPRIVGVAAAGAFAGGGRDEFSDLHRVLEVEPGTVAAIVGEHHRLAARPGPLVAAFTDERVGAPRLLICTRAKPAARRPVSI